MYICRINNRNNYIQPSLILHKYVQDSSVSFSIEPKLDIGLFVDFCVFD